MTPRRRASGAALSVGAALGAACLLSAAAMALLGVRPVVVRSGSMSPAIPTGSLALGTPRAAREVRVGEVVSVVAPSGARVMHRVVRSQPLDHHLLLTLKGDANDAPDAAPYPVDEVLVVRLHVPALGYLVDAASRPAGRFAGGALAGALLLLLLPPAQPAMPRGAHLARGPERRGSRPRVMAGAAALLLLAGIGADLARARPALASFADTGAVSVGPFGAYTVPTPAISSCTVSGNVLVGFTARIVWPGVASPQTLTYTAVIVESGTSLTVTVDAGNRRVDVATGLLGSLFGTDITVRLRAVLPTTPSWTSAATDQRLRVGLLGASLACL